MENFRLKNRWNYGGYIILWWFLGGLIFYCILNMNPCHLHTVQRQRGQQAVFL